MEAWEKYVRKLLDDPEFIAVAEKMGIIKKRKFIHGYTEIMLHIEQMKLNPRQDRERYPCGKIKRKRGRPKLQRNTADTAEPKKPNKTGNS